MTYQDELVALSAAVRNVVDGATPDVRAYGALVKDGERNPYTAEAEAVWRGAAGHDDWRDHHMAVLLHAHAFDLETAGSSDAPECWREALLHWARVHEDDLFWARLTRHLTDHVGMAVDAEVVAGLRRRLPAELLSVHVALVEAYRATDRERARSHMQILKGSPFASAVKDELRRSLVQRVVDPIPAAVAAGRYEECVDSLRDWLFIDDDNPLLIRSLLLTCRKWSETLWNDDWDRIRELVSIAREAFEKLDPASLRGNEPLVGEVARHWYWRAECASRAAWKLADPDASESVRNEVRELADQAMHDFDHAVQLDSHLSVDGFYHDLAVRKEEARVVLGISLFIEGREKEEAFGAAAEHFRLAIKLQPKLVPAYFYLAHALLAPAAVSDGALAEAEDVLDRAVPLVQETGSSNAEEQLEQLQQLLARERRWKGGGSDDRPPASTGGPTDDLNRIDLNVN